MQHKNDKFKINAWIAGGCFLMPAIFYPLNAFQIPPFRIVIVLILFFISVVVNRFRFNGIMLLFVCIYLILIGYKMMLYPESINDFSANRDVWLTTIVSGVMSLYFAATSYDGEYVIRVMNKVAVPSVLCIVIFINSFLSQISELHGWNMKLGFSFMLPLAVMAVYLMMNGVKHNKIELAIYILGVITFLMYSNRGGLMCHGILYLLMFIFYGYKRGIIKRYFMYILMVFSLVIVLKDIILEKCVELVMNVFDIYFIPYSWRTIITLYLSGDMEQFSARRNDIWSYAFDSLSENIFWGDYLGFIHKVSTSVHNIFLEILCDYGIFVFVVFIVFLLYRTYLYVKNRPVNNIPLLIIFTSAACEQLTSGYMFFQDNFMFLLGLLMARKLNIEETRNNREPDITIEVIKERQGK